MIAPLLKSALEPVVERHRRLRLINRLSIWWIAVALAAAALFAAGAASPRTLTYLICGAIAGAVVIRAFVRKWQPDFREIARRIEKGHPELHALLVTAVEQRPDPKSGSLHYLQQRVITDAIRVTRQHQWLDAIPRSRWIGGVALQGAALVAMLLAFRALDVPSHKAPFTRQPVVVGNGVDVTPGDTLLEHGSGLVVLAKFHGTIPGEATLVVQPRNEAPQRLPLMKSLNDPVFGGGLPEVTADFDYRVEYAGQSTRDFTVRVFEHPRLDRADATLHYPEYTKLQEKTVPDTRRISAVEGTKLDVSFQLNKPVKSAVLTGKDGREVTLTVDPAKAVASLKDFNIQASESYELHLVDADGRTNKMPAKFTVDALKNRRPELKFAMPKGDRRVSPIEEVTFRGEAWDDFGLARYGLTINVAGRGEQDIELGRDSRPDERREFTNVLKLEDIGVKPDELLSWYLWAEDTGPDGKTRRTATDMYFGEVRPFEEIYRAGDSAQAEQQERQQQEQQQQNGGAGSQAQKLAQLQKQIISATWNLKRSEDASTDAKKPTEKYLKDEPTVRDSQGDALNQVKAMSEKVQDPKSVALVENVSHEMEAARDRLAEAETSLTPLPAALGSEQSAYNALLKLSAHEYEVTRRQRSQSQRGQSQGQQANQRQLDELEMKDEKQRYETKQDAAPQQKEQQREQLAILNRLKELAQRQQDINERLKEIQASLQAAKTPQEKEDLRQQLKRLREEEQQMLADLDESRQKMEQSPQQSQLADERQKLDQTRAEAQQASEAMERNAPTQALASGARTARQLQQIRDDFRKKSSGQFNDEMREMRNNARALAQNQQEIEEKLKTDAAKPERPTLSGGDEQRQEVGQQLEKQATQLAGISDEMRRVSEEAEAVEPLLSKELYDTLRKTTQANTDQKLKNTKLLAERGFTPQAQKVEKEARDEVEELKKGVERAAESVLGNEAESLRQARDQLDSLAQQVDREIENARPDLADAGKQGQKPGTAKSDQDAANPDGANRDAQGNAAGRRNQGQQGTQNSEERTDAQQGTAQNGGAQRNGQRGQRPGEGSANDQKPGEQTAQNEAGKGSPDGGQRNGQGQGERRPPGERPQDGAADEGSPTGQTPDEQTASNDRQGRTPNGGQRNGRGQNAQGQQGAGQGDGAQPGQPGEQGAQTAQNGGQPGAGQPQQNGRQGGQPGGGGRNANPNAEPGDQAGSRLTDINRRLAGGGGGDGGGGGGALTGGGYVEWSDRLRNVEEMLDSPDLRNEAARIREMAKGVRVEFKKHSVQPDWDMVKMKISKPLAELRNRLTEQLATRDSKESLVPIDRDPVPPKYAERVRSYYEELGRSK